MFSEATTIQTDWPTFLGGQLDGHKARFPESFDTRYVVYPDPSPEDDSARYMYRKVRFMVEDRLIQIRVMAVSEMSDSDVAWELLCRVFEPRDD